MKDFHRDGAMTAVSATLAAADSRNPTRVYFILTRLLTCFLNIDIDISIFRQYRIDIVSKSEK